MQQNNNRAINHNRNQEENIILALCIVSGLGITPFAIYRLIKAQWLHAIIDFGVLLVVAGIFIYVLRTGQVRIPSRILSLAYLSGVVAINYVVSPSLIYWAYPTMAAIYFLLKPVEGLVINSIALCALLPALISGHSTLEMSGLLITLILNNSFAFLYARFSQQHQHMLARMATVDALTGVGNRALFVEDISHSIAEKQRFDTELSLIMMDLDHFKQINDKHGHLTGDAVLINLMDLCRERIRGIDRIYRIGGEEFAILVVGVGIDGACFLAEDIRNMVSNSRPEGIQVTVSLGVARCSATDNVESLMGAADKALYRAKSQGRDQVCVEPPENDPRKPADNGAQPDQ